MIPTVTVVVPVYNAAAYLSACLDAIRKLDPAPLECIVVDDGSEDDSAEIAVKAVYPVISISRRRGPAFARNAGARAARGGILLFVDADVEIPSGTAGSIVQRFVKDPDLAAVIGSYDNEPGSPNFLSQYRNLLNTYTHQSGGERSSTFWTGCGAIRKDAFRDQGGFCESLRYLEDIDLGLRMSRQGLSIRLDTDLKVKHLKRLGLFEIVHTDLIGRAIPWTRLILRYRSMPADLNLKWGQRFSVFLVGAMAALAVMQSLGRAADLPWLTAEGGLVLLLAVLNRGFYRFLTALRGPWFALRSFPLHCGYFFLSGLGFCAGILIHLLESDEEQTAAADVCED